MSYCRLNIERMLLLLLSGAAALPLFASEQQALTLGVHPYRPALELERRFQPLADYLAGRMARPVNIRISTDYESHVEAIGGDRLDIAYLGPASYVQMVRRHGRKPLLARQAIKGKPQFRGAIVVRKDSAVKKLGQLAGRRFAFGSPLSTMSHLAPRYTLLTRGGVDVSALAQYRFVGSHDNVALAVLSGDFDAGGVKEAVADKYASEGLMVLGYTDSISEHLFVASSQLPGPLAENLRKHLLSLHRHPDGPGILAAIKPGITALVPVEDADYSSLCRIMTELSRHGWKP